MANMSARFMSSPKLVDEAEKVLTSFFSERNTERRQILAADGKLSEEHKRTEEDRRRRDEEAEGSSEKERRSYDRRKQRSS